MKRYTHKSEDGRYYIESANGKLESDIKGRVFGKAIERFAELENSDVVKVVRCEDCEFWKPYSGRIDAKVCYATFDHHGRERLTNPDDFCSCGKRRKEE